LNEQKDDENRELTLRLSKQFPNDVGIFAAFLMNHLILAPGEALYLGANMPHAYLFGDCIECMACSDNVVRAGLTPKHKDVNILVSMLTYESGKPQVMTGKLVDGCTSLYNPPSTEFQLTRSVVPENTEYVLNGTENPAIMICMEGTGTIEDQTVKKGDVFLIGKKQDVQIRATTNLNLFRCYAPQ